MLYSVFVRKARGSEQRSCAYTILPDYLVSFRLAFRSSSEPRSDVHYTLILPWARTAEHFLT
jgi:hypothetical protein